MKKFVHLHVHSHYSLLDGLPKIPELLDYTKELGMESVALTDHGNLYGLIEFYQEAIKRNIKPILGCEVYVAQGSMDQKQIDDKSSYHLTLLAENKIGYQNLIKLVTEANLRGFYYKPRVDKNLLRENSQGLIALSGFAQGKIPQLILKKRFAEAKDEALEYQKIFGTNNFYLEIQNCPSFDNQTEINNHLSQISQETGIPLVATNDVHYLRPADEEAQEILLMVNTHTNVETTNRMTMIGSSSYLASPEEMHETFKDYPEALNNTLKIAERCSVEIELNKLRLPKFKPPQGKKTEAYLRELCQEGIEKKFKETTPEIKERLAYELSVIDKMDFASYFLIVHDFIKWAKDQHIVVGPGRGSAPGSLVSYLLDITTIDPLKHKLIFERFLNPERISMPDIDIDFADHRRDEVIEYVANKYGRNHVAQIITFGTMAARGSIRDVGRALGYSYNFCDQIAKSVPLNMNLSQALASVKELKEKYESEEQAHRLIDLAMKIEGTARHASTHACGVVVADRPLSEIIPLQLAPQKKDKIITQYSMEYVEALGLLKMDFLGLRNLTIIEETLRRIYAIHKIDLEVESIPSDDKKTYQLLQRAETTGVFQLESSGMKSNLKQLKPNRFEDIVAMVALYRPGPMQFIPQYISRKHGREKFNYLHPELKEILSDTYGIAVYQEQIIQIAHKMAGFSLSEADTLRKAIGKKKKDLLDKQQGKLIQGMIENKISEKIAKEIWNWIIPFASYSFNLAHATSYATIAYQTAYLKAHYPLEFMSSLLTSHSGNNDKIAFLIQECRRANIEILPPDINESFFSFSVVPKEKVIRFGLSAIKNVSQKLVEQIIDERKQNGSFKSFEDFIARTCQNGLDKKSLESMARAGVFDNLIERNKIVNNIKNILDCAQEIKKQSATQQASLFQTTTLNPTIHFDSEGSITTLDKLSWEKELLGLYVSAHPLNHYEKMLSKVTTPLKDIDDSLVGKMIRVGGIVNKIHNIITKNNERMLFLELEDLTDKVEIVVFPRVLDMYAKILKEGNIILVKGRIDHRNGSLQMIGESAEELISQN
jgi:DNA polymerase III subunit alpha